MSPLPIGIHRLPDAVKQILLHINAHLSPLPFGAHRFPDQTGTGALVTLALSLHCLSAFTNSPTCTDSDNGCDMLTMLN